MLSRTHVINNWVPIAEATKIQDGATITATITPEGTIPGIGKVMNCLFGGTYTEEFQFRFMTENNVTTTITGKVGTTSPLTIPKNNMNRPRQVYFEYNSNGTWKRLDERTQALDPAINADKPLAGEFGDQEETEVDVEL